MLSSQRTLSAYKYSSRLFHSKFSTFSTMNKTRPAVVNFGSSWESVSDFQSTTLIGRKESMERLLPNLLEPLGLDKAPKSIVNSMISSLDAKKGGSATTLVEGGTEDVHRLSLAGLPTNVSRYGHPFVLHKLTKMAGDAPKGNARIVMLSDDQPIGALASAIARAFPLFSQKTKAIDSDPPADRQVHVVFAKSDGSLIPEDEQLKAARIAASNVRLAARLLDSHPQLLTTTQFAKEVEDLVRDHPKVKMTQIVGDELFEKGYGGLHGVGRAANHPPRLVLLEYDGSDGKDVETVALVGKGIVYDTGGLALKPKVGMCGMKGDMGGAAGLFGGFWSAVQIGVPKKVHCILCLAENAIGPDAFRHDDVLDMYSGKTVEINNTDAEGRLVLADGVAHATKHIENLDLVVDMATLTGAQPVTTGNLHAGIVANTAELETRARQAGMSSGDLCFPMLYSPEILMDEFKSEVADMKNSVKDRSNAQASCAGHFIESHLNESYQGGWLHVDMAGPATIGERGTGYGVGLVLGLLSAPGF